MSGGAAVAAAPPALAPPPACRRAKAPAPEALRRVWLGGRWRRVAVHDRESLPPGTVVSGPALVLERHSATLVGRQWELFVDGAAALVMRRVDRARRPRRAVEESGR